MIFFCILPQGILVFHQPLTIPPPFQVQKLVPAVQPGCVLSRSNLVPSCATRSESPRLPTARILHLWPFLAINGSKWLEKEGHALDLDQGRPKWQGKSVGFGKIETWDKLTGLSHYDDYQNWLPQKCPLYFVLYLCNIYLVRAWSKTNNSLAGKWLVS